MVLEEKDYLCILIIELTNHKLFEWIQKNV